MAGPISEWNTAIDVAVKEIKPLRRFWPDWWYELSDIERIFAGLLIAAAMFLVFMLIALPASFMVDSYKRGVQIEQDRKESRERRMEDAERRRKDCV